MLNLIDRVTATQTTIDTYHERPFEWGQADCARLAAHHLHTLGLNTRLDEARGYSTELGAKRALKKLGANSMEDLADAMGFDRIPPASAIVGDLIGFPGGREGAEWTALGVHVGGDRIMGFADPDGTGARCEFGPTHVCTVAWRVG